MKITFLRSYPSRKTGTITFVYRVTGAPEDLAKYKDIQGSNYREDDDGTPLFFTVNCVGTQGKLIITSNNKVIPDMTQFHMAASLAKQFGGNFGDQIASEMAQNILGNKNTQPSADAESQAAPEQDDTSLGDL